MSCRKSSTGRLVEQKIWAIIFWDNAKNVQKRSHLLPLNQGFWSEYFTKEVFFCGIYTWFKIFLEIPIYTLFSFKKSTLKHWKHFFCESKQTHSTPHEDFIFVALNNVLEKNVFSNFNPKWSQLFKTVQNLKIGPILANH